MRQLSFDFPGRRGRQRIPLEKRFWAKVDKSGPVPPHVPELGACWIWVGMRDRQGYGRMKRSGKAVKASRLAWQLSRGPIPPGVGAHGTCVLHRCDNPPCCNPAHLFLGTAADNMRDMRAKGRHTAGTRSAVAKLTDAQVQEIRLLYAQPERPAMRALARRFGVSRSLVHAVVQRKVWRHVA